VMCVLALPFVFGSLRTAGSGARMLIGVAFGLGYFLLSRTLTDSGEFFEMAPLIIAWSPTLVLLAITTVMLARVR
jgi:lipopolysaccharide export system permease protein